MIVHPIHSNMPGAGPVNDSDSECSLREIIPVGILTAGTMITGAKKGRNKIFVIDGIRDQVCTQFSNGGKNSCFYFPFFYGDACSPVKIEFACRTIWTQYGRLPF